MSFDKYKVRKVLFGKNYFAYSKKYVYICGARLIVMIVVSFFSAKGGTTFLTIHIRNAQGTLPYRRERLWN